ncbi:hypothetical protein AKG09_02225 [Neisseria sp. 83E34]|nr:hypothetical protein AKG09_02225 [Neisseria sp. 83E34]
MFDLDDEVRLAVILIPMLIYCLIAFYDRVGFDHKFFSLLGVVCFYWWIISEIIIYTLIMIGSCDGCISWFK